MNNVRRGFLVTAHLSLALLCLSILSAPAAARDIYISQSAQGAQNGSSCANAQSISWIDTQSNWTNPAAPIGAGDTIHICGSISTGLVVLGGGAPNNPLTVVFEPNAKFSAPSGNGLPFGAFVFVDGEDWVTIDGGKNGVIECTDNGTALGSQTDVWGVRACYLKGSNNLTIKNLTIRNLYVRTPDSMDPNGMGHGIVIGGSNVSVLNNHLSDGEALIEIAWGTVPTSNIVVDGNSCLRVNHGITLGAGQTTGVPQIDHVTISNNYIDGMDVYEAGDGSVDIGFHRNGIFIFDESIGKVAVLNSLRIFGNRIGPGIDPKTTTAGSAGIFFDLDAKSINGCYVFNNVLSLAAPLIWSNGWGGAGGLDTLFANNTIVGWKDSSGHLNGGYVGVIGKDAKVFNNVDASGSGLMIGQIPPTTFQIDHNIYFQADRNAFVNIVNGSNAFYDTITQWQTALGFDVHSSTADPLFVNSSPRNGNYHLTAQSPAINFGINLSSYCADDKAGPALCADVEGRLRPKAGAWDAGAYQYSDATAVDVPSNDPSHPTQPGSSAPSDDVVSKFLPFNPLFDPLKDKSLPITFQIKESAFSLGVYDRAGRLVKKLWDGDHAPGVVSDVSWDGRNQKGELVSSGSYTLVLKSSDGKQTRKVVVLK